MPGIVRAPQAAAVSLGILSLGGIVFNATKLGTDLEAVLFFERAGRIMAIAYLVMLVFHVVALGTLFRSMRDRSSGGRRTVFLLLAGLSLFGLAVQKVMFDEVAREYYLEYPMPGETVFIYFGLLLNAVFTVYATATLYFWGRTSAISTNKTS